MPELLINVEDVDEQPINNARFGGVATNSTSMGSGRYGVTVSQYGTVTVSASGYNSGSVRVSAITSAYSVTLSSVGGGNGNGGWF